MKLERYRINNGQKIKVPSGKKWEIMHGRVWFVTGTDTYLILYDERDTAQLWILSVDTAKSTESFMLQDLIHTNAEVLVDIRGMEFPEDWSIGVTGDAAAYAFLLIKETEYRKLKP